LKRNVVTIADASAKPKTVVVKTTNAAVADVAVDSAGWSENQACLTKFDGLSQDRSAIECSLIQHQVKVSLRTFYELVFS
jgi:hypothetical protein